MLSTQKNKLSFLLLILCFGFIHAQKKRTAITGIVTDASGTVKNVHIYNSQSKEGAFSNDLGFYEISVTIGDTLKISSIQHHTITRIVNDTDIERKTINLVLNELVNVLDEVIIKKHDLTGRLDLDIKKTPIDTIGQIVSKLNNDIKNMPKDAIMNMPYGKDEIHLKKTPSVTDPNSAFKGVGGGFGFGSGKRKKQKIKKITSDSFTSQKVVDAVGKDFFIQLKIPEVYIYSFIDFCKKFNIKELYEQKKILELLKLFEQKSIVYLSQIKKE